MADVSADSVHQRIPARDILTRDAALLTDTVREAGALALSLFRTELKNWTKGASSPVSEADIRVNDLLESRLRSATPDYGWLSEESVDDEAPLVQFFSSVPNSDSASAPASRTVSVSSAASRALVLSTVSASAKRQT
ncbi:MAG TPA: hypothetical protein VK561_09970, partial [Bradyrhizobium sp.]|nr:hypothetical protein [Bradyrhizobium sp.]